MCLLVAVARFSNGVVKDLRCVSAGLLSLQLGLDQPGLISSNEAQGSRDSRDVNECL